MCVGIYDMHGEEKEGSNEENVLLLPCLAIASCGQKNGSRRNYYDGEFYRVCVTLHECASERLHAIERCMNCHLICLFVICLCFVSGDGSHVGRC